MNNIQEDISSPSHTAEHVVPESKKCCFSRWFSGSMFVVTFTKPRAMMFDGGDLGAGWRGWVVVIAAFFVQFIVCGITYTMGITHVMLRQVFVHSHFDTSWVASWLLVSTAASSVLLRCVTAKYGCRVSVMLGGVLAATGLALGMVVTELYQVYLTFGLLTGTGFGLACTPSIVAVEKYFRYGRFQALSVAAGGIGAGIITFPLIMRYLLDYYAWRGTLLILAAIALNLCVCGAVMKPLPYEKDVKLLPMFSLIPFQNPLFHAMMVSHLFWSFGSTVIYLYLPSYAMDEGTDFSTSIFLITCIGMASFTSRMIFAFMGSNSALDIITEILCTVGIGLVVTGLCPVLFEKYSGQIGYTILFGFYSGFWTTFLSQVSRELIGSEHVALGNGYLAFMIGIGSLLGGPAAGLLLQKEDGMFKYVFYLAGACLLMSSTLMTLFKLNKQCMESYNYPTVCQKQQSRQKARDEKYLDDLFKDSEKGTEMIVEAHVTSV